MMEMKWMGDKVQNFGTRIRAGKKYTPIAIVNHISAGTMGSMDAWFRNPAAQASSHFGISREGVIHQYVRLEHAAWTQGLMTEGIPIAPHSLVRGMGVNPNLYCISKEHEGYSGNGGNGELTETQFWASVWLDKYIQQEVEREWNHHIQFTPEFVLGHFQIDPIRKPFCPGPAFPWARTYTQLAKAEVMTFEEWEEYIEYQRGGNSDYAQAYAVSERARDLGAKIGDPKWGKPAEAKLLWLSPILPAIGYEGEVTAAGIADRLLQLYATLVKGGKFAGEALRKLLIVYTLMKAKSLL
jgi:N-acetyl-anhydromuramyl-L-alanine amidase AmpD